MSAVLNRSFLRGRTMGDAVIEERTETALLLRKHRLYQAASALVASANFGEYMQVRSAMLAGGFHRVRLTGGRSIDG